MSDGRCSVNTFIVVAIAVVIIALTITTIAAEHGLMGTVRLSCSLCQTCAKVVDVLSSLTSPWVLGYSGLLAPWKLPVSAEEKGKKIGGGISESF